MPAIASTLPRAREGGAKAISEMERLESKFDRSDQAFKTQVIPTVEAKAAHNQNYKVTFFNQSSAK